MGRLVEKLDQGVEVMGGRGWIAGWVEEEGWLDG